jgi:hypothetical protein
MPLRLLKTIFPAFKHVTPKAPVVFCVPFGSGRCAVGLSNNRNLKPSDQMTYHKVPLGTIRIIVRTNNHFNFLPTCTLLSREFDVWPPLFILFSRPRHSRVVNKIGGRIIILASIQLGPVAPLIHFVCDPVSDDSALDSFECVS